MTIAVISTTAMCMEPFFSPSQPEIEWLYLSQGWLQCKCPCCHEFRLFPSVEFVIERRNKLTEKEERDMVLAISDYTGDIVPGRLCPFCGVNLPTAKDFK